MLKASTMRDGNKFNIDAIWLLKIVIVILVLPLFLQKLQANQTKCAPKYYETIMQTALNIFCLDQLTYHLVAAHSSLASSLPLGLAIPHAEYVGSEHAAKAAIGSLGSSFANGFASSKRLADNAIAGFVAIPFFVSWTVDNFFDFVAAHRIWIAERFSGLLPQPYQTILMGMVLGNQGFLSDRYSHSIETMGIQHIFSVSGANFTVLAELLLFPIRRWATKRQLMLLVPVSLCYSAIVGVQYPVLRACCMFLYARFARGWLRVQARPLYALLLWVVTAVWLIPGTTKSISFQLTVAATLGILICYQPILSISRRLLEERRWLHTLLEPLLLGVAVFVGVGPVLSWHFGEVSLAGIFYSALLFWLIEMLSIVGFVALGYSYISYAAFPHSLQLLSDQIVGSMATALTSPMVFILEQQTVLPGFALQATPVVQAVGIGSVTLIILFRLRQWWRSHKTRLLSSALVERTYG